MKGRSVIRTKKSKLAENFALKLYLHWHGMYVTLQVIKNSFSKHVTKRSNKFLRSEKELEQIELTIIRAFSLLLRYNPGTVLQNKNDWKKQYNTDEM